MTSTARLQIPELAATEDVSNGPTRINEGWSKIDSTDLGYEDFLQAGVVKNSDWSFAATCTAAGMLGSEAMVGGVAWLPDPIISGGLMRSVTAAAKLENLEPSSKPAEGKFRCIAFELTPATWNAAATVSLNPGSEQSTALAAEEHPPSTAAGKIQVRRVIMKRVGSSYSIEPTQFDVRPLALGRCSGHVYIPAEETRENVAFGTMGTPDEVTVLVPENGLVVVRYQALWREGVGGKARAAIFIGGSQLVAQSSAEASYGPQPQAAATAFAEGHSQWQALTTFPLGLATASPELNENYGPDVSTGQVVGQFARNLTYQIPNKGGGYIATGPGYAGGACEIFGLPSGLHTISIRFVAASSWVKAWNRRLWVEARSF